MSQQKSPMTTRESLINIRKLAAMDIVFHGSRLILAEFALAVLVSGVLGILSLSFFLRTASHPLFALALGIILLGIAFNYVPLLLYSISIARHKSARQEVSYELEHQRAFARKYGMQQLLLMVPLFIAILSLVQELRHRSDNGH